MPVLQKLEKHKHVPVAILYQGGDALGVELSKLLIEQGAFVILIDEYSDKKKNLISELSEKELFSFFDISGTASLAESIGRVDYIFYFNHQLKNPDEEVSTRDFLERSNRLDRLLQLGVDKKSKFLLTTSIKLHRLLQLQKEVGNVVDDGEEALQYNALEVQRYAENLTWEYYKRGGLDARIVRLGQLLGEGIELGTDTLLGSFFKNAISGQKLQVEGDGLENIFFIHLLDAAYGLIKAQFTEKASGKIYSLVIPRDITILNLAYKILDLEPKAAGIDFVEQRSTSEVGAYKPAVNLKELGWKPKISFERALAQSIDYAYQVFGKSRRKKTPETQDEEAEQKVQKLEKPKEKKGLKNVIVDLFFERKEKGEAAVKEQKATPPKDITEEMRKEKREQSRKKSFKDMLVNFFFEVKEEKQPKSVLDNIQYQQRQDQRRKESPSKKKESFMKRHVSKKKKKKDTGKFKSFSWRIVDLFERVKRSIRAISLPTLFGYGLVAVVLIFVYVLLFTPILRILYHTGMVSIRMDGAVQSFQSWEFARSEEELGRIIQSIDSIDANLDRLSFLSTLRFYDDIRLFRDQLQDDRLAVKELQNVATSLRPLESYFDEYQTNVNLLGEDNLIAGASDTYYALSGLQNLSARLDRSSQVIGTYQVQEPAVSLPVIDGVLREFRSNVGALRQEFLNNSDIFYAIPEILAVREPATTALILLDNTSMTLRGGEIAAVCVYTIDGGSITDIAVYDPDEIQVNFATDQMNIIRDDLGNFFPSDGFSFEDTSMISDEDIYFDVVTETIGNDFGRSPENVLTLNFNMLRDLFAIVDAVDLSGGGKIEASNFDELMNNETTSSKEVLAKVIKKLSDIDKETIVGIHSKIRENISDNDLQVYTHNVMFREYINPQNTSEFGSLKDTFSMSMLGDVRSMPSVNIEARAVVAERDVSTEYLIELTQLEGNYEGSIVVDFGSSFELEDIQSDSAGAAIVGTGSNRASGELSLQDGDTVELLLKGTSQGIVTEDANGYNYAVVLNRPFGFIYDYVYNLIHTGYVLSSVPEGGTQGESSYSVNGKLLTNLSLNYTLISSEG